jgi:hypothetical protein
MTDDLNSTDGSRRRFLAMAGLVPVALVAGRAALAATPPAPAAGPACYDPATLSLSQKSRRRSLAYYELSTDPARRCGGCAFFVPAAAGSTCGSCQLLGNAPVKAEAVCASFAPKPAAPK